MGPAFGAGLGPGAWAIADPLIAAVSRPIMRANRCGAVTPCPRLSEMRHDLFADQLQRAHHDFGRDRRAEIQLEQYAIDAELGFELLEAIDNPLRAADHDLVAQHLLI